MTKTKAPKKATRSIHPCVGCGHPSQCRLPTAVGVTVPVHLDCLRALRKKGAESMRKAVVEYAAQHPEAVSP